jgi:hypothetical protein
MWPRIQRQFQHAPSLPQPRQPEDRYFQPFAFWREFQILVRFLGLSEVVRTLPGIYILPDLPRAAQRVIFIRADCTSSAPTRMGSTREKLRRR